MGMYSGTDRRFITECFDRARGHCTRCGRRLNPSGYHDARHIDGWVIATRDGRVVGVLCSECFDRFRAATQQRRSQPPRRREPENIIMGKGYTFAPGHSDWHPF